MSALEYAGPNAEQIQYWNEQRGRSWVAQQDLIDAQLAPLGRRAMDHAAIALGERMLDVGCGCGQTTLELAQRVGPSGTALGADISSVMLTRARELARAAGVGNVRFEEADAQTHAFPPSAFDVLFSRFGVMFFADPRAAFTNLRAALRPGGRLAFVCWRTLPENPWMAVPLMAAFQHIPPPPIPGPNDPGPFAFADPERVRGVLTHAGFTAVACDTSDEEIVLGGGAGVDKAVEFILQLGPTAAALREAGPAKTAEVAAAVGEALRPYYVPGAGVRMAAATWIVSARQP
ncbi:MAG: class I SAM-dependent methyltransferase [Deltaproteobacteria bacterium]|nr:class I SAM-dependent methyltransferase [Deltaproteobacteria bacterium]